jgi:nucleoside-diphosphate-sugar epimerase
MLGSHLVRLLVDRGEAVRALVRPGSDTRLLDQLGVEQCVGNLDEPRNLLPFAEGADIVFHCAAHLGDWGPWADYFRHNVLGTVNLLKACEVAAIGRFLHVSSVGVYGHPRDRDELFTESEPLGQNLWWWDYYIRSKILAEQRVQIYPGDWTIVRPGWTYGPGDRHSLPRAIAAIGTKRVRLIGSGKNRLSLVFVEDVADGVYRAATHPDAAGQVYNLASSGEVTQEDFGNTFTDEMGLPRIRGHVPVTLAFWAAFLSEVWGRLWGWKNPPRVTRYAVALISRSTRFSSEKARTQLGWAPRVSLIEGVRRTLAWFYAQPGGRGGSPPD